MKRMLTLIATGLMLTAPAALAEIDLADWEIDPLHSHWRLSKIMEGPVYSSDNVQVGEVHDVILGPTGLITSVVVERKKDDGLGWKYFEVEWLRADFDPLLGHVDLEMTREKALEIPTRELPNFKGDEEYEASDLLGLDVNLDDARPYGEIVDLLVSPSTNDVESFVVASDGIGDLRYALPANFDQLDTNRMQVDLPYVVDEVEDLELWVEITG